MPARRWLEAAAAAGLLGLAMPAWAQTGHRALADAIAARDAGRSEEAVVRLEALAVERPEDTTVLRLLATSLAAAGRQREAGATIARARRIAPRDRDLMLAEARIALWSGEPQRARRMADAIAAIEPWHPELPGLRTAIAASPARKGGLGLSASHGLYAVESTGGVNRTWRESAIALDVPLAPARITFEAEHSDRGFATDTRLGARADRRIADSAAAYLAVRATPGADFRERWSLAGGGEAQVATGVSLQIDARYADYRNGSVIALEPGARLQTRDGRYGLTLRWINLWDADREHRSGAAGRLDVQAREGLAVFASAATYPDTEGGVTRRVDAIAAGVSVALSPELDLRISGEHEERASSYRRSGATLGLRWRHGR